MGREAPRQTSNNKQQQQQERGVDAKGSRRCGSVAKETRGRNGRKAKEKLDVGEGLGAVSRRSPVHGLRGGRRREHELVLVREPNPPQPDGDHGEQRAHFPFGDVTAEHGGSRGHASDERIHLHKY